MDWRASRYISVYAPNPEKAWGILESVQGCSLQGHILIDCDKALAKRAAPPHARVPAAIPA